jgi:hypothetical protein
MRIIYLLLDYLPLSFQLQLYRDECYGKMIMNSEQVRICKGPIVVYLKVPL